MEQQLNILIIEDHPLIVDSYKNTLNNFNQSQKSPKFHIWKSFEQVENEIKDFDLANIDLVLLDLQLPVSQNSRFLAGEEVGVELKRKYSGVKILVITSLYDNFRISNILKGLDPHGLLIKNDIGALELNNAISCILKGEVYYSQKVLSIIRSKINHNIYLDPQDVKLLYQLSQGSKTNELPELLNLSATSVERRKRKIKEILNLEGETDRKLLDVAKAKGFI